MQRIARRDRLVRVEMDPALPSLVFRARVPGVGENLHAAVWKGRQILLQRLDAERVVDGEISGLAILAFCLDDECAVLAEEPRLRSEVFGARLVEVSEDGTGRRGLHRARMLGLDPCRTLTRMTAGTSRGSCVAGRSVARKRTNGRRLGRQDLSMHNACRQNGANAQQRQRESIHSGERTRRFRRGSLASRHGHADFPRSQISLNTYLIQVA